MIGSRPDRAHKLVHRLVLEAFAGPCPDGMEACHGDGDPTNNRRLNLRWDTRSSNQLDTVRHGRHTNANRTHCVNGHAFTTENTYIYRNDATHRMCRTCHRERQAASRQKE